MAPQINIRNKQTGEVKTINLDEAGNFGISAGDALTIFEDQQKLQTTVETGEVPLDKKDVTLTEKEKLFQSSVKAAEGALKSFQTGEVTTGPVQTRLAKLGERFPGAKATTGTTFRSQLAFTRTIIRNALLGGTITEQESEALKAGLPEETDQEDIVRQKLEDFIKQFGEFTEEAGVAAPTQEPEGETSLGGKIVAAGKGVKDFLLGSSINLAEDVGVGLALGGEEGQATQESQQQAIEAARRSMELAQTTEDPEQKARLEKVARETLERVGLDTGAIGALASEDIDKSVAERSIASALEIAGAAEIPFLPRDIVKTARATKKILTKAPGAIKKLNPFNAVGKKRDAAIKAMDDLGVTIDTTQIADEVAEWATNKAPTTLRKSAAKYAEEAASVFKNKASSVADVVDDLHAANEAAFLQSGKQGRAAAAKFEKIVGDSLRKQLAEHAPDVAKANKAFERLFKIKRFAKSSAFPLKIAGGLIGAGAGLNVLFGGGD